MKKIFLSLIIFLSINNFLEAQNNVEFSAQIRPRFEVDNKDFNNATETKNLGLLRTRVAMKFSPAENLELFFQAQDSRDMGYETNSLTNMKNLDVHQAYVKLRNFFELPVDIKLGRMEITYGSGRFLGINNWNNVGRAFDGAVVSIKANEHKFDFIAVKEEENYQFGDSADVDILAFVSDIYIASKFKVQPFIMWQKNTPLNILSRFSTGIYSKGALAGYFHEADLAYQFGELTDENGAKLNIAAYIASITVGVKLNLPVKPTFNAGLDILSGDDNPNDESYNVFVSPYGDKHKFYGMMDYFKNNPLHTYNLGMINIRGGIAIDPVTGLNVKLDMHLLNSFEDYILNNGSRSKQFGTEGDLTIKYKYSEYINLQAGASIFIPGEIFEETKGSDNSFWFYFMMVANL
ncbi:alginate export family protein [Bacteroidota bacterium]